MDTSLDKYRELKIEQTKEVSKIPGLEVSLFGFERKLQIAETVYMFLLQKKKKLQ